MSGHADIPEMPLDDNYVLKAMTEHFENWAAEGKINSNEYVNLMNLAKDIHTERDKLVHQLWNDYFQTKNLFLESEAKYIQAVTDHEKTLRKLTAALKDAAAAERENFILGEKYKNLLDATKKFCDHEIANTVKREIAKADAEDPINELPIALRKRRRVRN